MSAQPAPHFKLLLPYKSFSIISLRSTAAGQVRPHDYPERLAFSERKAPLVWSERWSWAGWGSGLYIVQIPSWWSVIWTVCRPFSAPVGPLLDSSSDTAGPAVKHSQLWSLIDTKSPAADSAEERAQGTGWEVGGGGAVSGLGDLGPADTFVERSPLMWE